jgi:hypothetical protein
MGKASRRRQSRRVAFLAKLAAEAPDRFSVEWNKRLDSWAHEAQKNVQALGGRDDGCSSASTSRLLAHVDNQLARCGADVYEREAVSSREALLNAAAIGLASAVEPGIYRITETGPTCHRADLYRSKGKTRRG